MYTVIKFYASIFLHFISVGCLTPKHPSSYGHGRRTRRTVQPGLRRRPVLSQDGCR